jgi:hypothetical protein
VSIEDALTLFIRILSCLMLIMGLVYLVYGTLNSKLGFIALGAINVTFAFISLLVELSRNNGD